MNFALISEEQSLSLVFSYEHQSFGPEIMQYLS